MSLKTIGLKATLAAALVTGASMATAPAQAASLGPKTQILGNSVLSFAGTYSLTNASGATRDLSGTTTLKFNTINIFDGGTEGGSTGSFTSLTGSAIFKTLTLENGSITSPVTSFISGLTLNGKALSFDLTDFALRKTTVTNPLGGNVDGFIAGIEGNFIRNGGELFGEGAYTSQFRSNGSFSGDITAVPAPALLPGLVGLGLGIVRKRKQGEAEKAEAKA
ncbi:PTPA-CTERM sorting domain-containing protein [Leptolyngbya sp. FACHB-261]|uniref:PTPA-CTERM sorting domain-containing protein n=1 Tax=Leptolyngbya sp. FACHB-261 TaxID=2692806 RepID=UPI001688C859|nr:PTPA-CTERM sorting domain-containing protein [Leptolyngbya sp. FACHB-261]MBD2101115.1 PTPA-CTERM sorting domain-containing protein [Leptolyngbya sp. FACHB-261]